MVKQYVTRAAFARLAGVSAAAVTKAAAKALAPACTGRRIDASHPAALKYIADHDDALPPKAAKPAPRGPAPPKPAPPSVAIKSPAPRGHVARRQKQKQAATDEDQIYEIPEDIQAFADMTLRDLVGKFGTDLRFLDWLKATKAIEDINEKRLKNAKTQGELVSRELVKVGIIDPVDAAHIKLLTDGSKTIARRSVAMQKAGRPLEDIEKFVAEQITSFIRPIKAKVARALRNA